jgi:hypothetical protein
MWICEKNAHCVDECDGCEHYIEVEPVRHGKWIEKEKAGFLHCSNCGYIPIMFNFEYCPKCGAKMDGE